MDSATENPKGRQVYAEWLRIIAAFAVVFQHCASSSWYLVPVGSGDFTWLTFYNSLSRFGVGIFFMISGAFMLSPHRECPPKKIFRKNLPRLIIPLVIWVILYGCLDVIITGGGIAGFLSTPLLVFTKPTTHLWFLYVLAGLYLLTPALRIYTANASRKLQLYVVGLFFTFGLLIPTISTLLREYAGFPLYSNLTIQGLTSFVSYYLAGYYLAEFGLGNKARKALYIVAILSWIITFYGALHASEIKEARDEFFMGNYRPTVFLMAAAIFTLFREKFKGQITSSKQMLAISTGTMGIYLIHPLLIKGYYGLGLSMCTPHPLITVPAITLLVFCASFLLVHLFKKFPFHRT